MSKTYTWEELEFRRELLKKELQKKELEIEKHSKRLFATPKTEDTWERLLNYAQAGTSAYDGFLTGFKLLKSLMTFFRKRKKKD